MYAKHPKMAKRWSKHTKKGKKLPEHVKHSAAYIVGAMAAHNKQANVVGNMGWEASKFIPVAGAIPSFWDAGKALLKGQFGKALLEGGMGALSLVPGAGTLGRTIAGAGKFGGKLVGRIGAAGGALAGKAGMKGSEGITRGGLAAKNWMQGGSKALGNSAPIQRFEGGMRSLGNATGVTAMGQGLSKGVTRVGEHLATQPGLASPLTNLGRRVARNPVAWGQGAISTTSGFMGQPQ